MPTTPDQRVFLYSKTIQRSSSIEYTACLSFQLQICFRLEWKIMLPASKQFNEYIYKARARASMASERVQGTVNEGAAMHKRSYIKALAVCGRTPIGPKSDAPASTGIRPSLGSMLAAAPPLSASLRNFRYALRPSFSSLFSTLLRLSMSS
jgi:hypothetical protein